MKKVKIIFDETKPEDLIEIVAKEDSAIVRKIDTYVKENFPNSIVCYKNNQLFNIPLDKIFKIYCRDSFVFLKTEDQEYEIKERLFEIEKQVEAFSFFKINKSEIINITKVVDFDFTYSGTVHVHFKNGDISTVSRRQIIKLKKFLEV